MIFLLPLIFTLENMKFPTFLDFILCFILGLFLQFSLNFIIKGA